ncbi:MAG: FkbM family methyltransferase [Gemmataceae bacterium]
MTAPLSPQPWFATPEIVKQLPLSFRWLALYWRTMRLPNGRTPGGSFLYRLLRRFRAAFGLPSTHSVRLDEGVIWLNLADDRFNWVLAEIRADSFEKRWLREYLHPGGTFIDVGANHGSFSLLASRIVGDDGFVLAVEPNPVLSSLVEKTLQENHFSGSYVFRGVCSSDNEEKEFYVPVKASSGTASLSQAVVPGRTEGISVESSRLDDLMSRVNQAPHNLFIKIDVEGHEGDVLKGAELTIGRHRPAILFELNPEALQKAGGSARELLELLRDLGYTRLLSGSNETLSIDQVIQAPSQQNLLALP